MTQWEVDREERRGQSSDVVEVHFRWGRLSEAGGGCGGRGDYGYGIEFLISPQKGLILAQMVRTEPVGWLLEMVGEFLDDPEAGFYGTLSVITTLLIGRPGTGRILGFLKLSA